MELANTSSYWIEDANCISFDTWDQFTTNCEGGCPAFWRNFFPLTWGCKKEHNKWKIQLIYINPYDMPTLLAGRSVEGLQNTFERRVIECIISDKDIEKIKYWLTKTQNPLWKVPLTN